jgi:hypothetical protein
MTEENKGGGVSVVGAPAINLEETIANDLSKSEEVQDTTTSRSEVVEPAFDISKLSADQLQQLAAALRAVPERVDTKKNKTVKVRQVMVHDEPRLVIDFKRAFIGLVDDHENQRKVERHIIPVLVEGETEFKNMQYSDFMQSPQVVCEVVKMSKEEVPIVEGETYDLYDRLVEMTRIEVEYTLLVKKPDGTTLELPGRVANA